MNSSPLHGLHLSPKQLVSWLTILLCPLGSALAFVVQPMMAKSLLPALGGTAATWLGAMLFFQLSLLLGYAWGIWIARRSLKFQCMAQGGLALLAVISFHLPVAHGEATTVNGVVLTLSAACLPALVLLFSLSPWLQTWREHQTLAEPYALYAVSNVGSLLALVLYPFAIEPYLGLGDQFMIWRAFLFLLAAFLVNGVVLLWWLAPAQPAGLPVAGRGDDFSPLRWLLWIGLSALLCVVMLAATDLISVEIGAVPLAWVGPFGVYLAAFVLVFCGRWRSWMTGTAVVGLGLSLSAYMALKGFQLTTVEGARLWTVLLACGFASLVGVALLHVVRPSRGGEWFYLALALGGVLGGWFSIHGVPIWFKRPLEFPLAAALMLAGGLFWGAGRRHPGVFAACLALSVGPVLIVGFNQEARLWSADKTITRYRDVYGQLLIEADAVGVVLSNGTTAHGSQLIETAESRRRPTYYYTESSAVGRAFADLQAERPALRIGVVGLGAGTLAAYTRAEDELRFYDIDPKIEGVARRHFTYLDDAKGKIVVQVADGRMALAAETADFDLVVIDAFMGDAVPLHLLTREALANYWRRLKARNGLLVVHVSQRYNQPFDYLAATALSLNLDALQVTTSIEEAGAHSDWDALGSDYVVIGSAGRLSMLLEKLPVEEEGGRVCRVIKHMDAVTAVPRGIWTDDRSATLDSMDLGRWLSP